MTTPAVSGGTPFGLADLTSCDREITHLPGAIQPHGILLAVEEPGLIVRQASANCAVLCGVAAEALLGHPLAAFVPPSSLTLLAEALGRLHLESNPLYLVTLPVGPAGRLFTAAAHRLDGLLLLELEPALPSGLVAAGEVPFAVREIMAELLHAPLLRTLCEVAARRVRALTGFDRVWVYRFHEDLHGEIIAEDIAGNLTSFLGLHYPAGDIPLSTRRLFLTNGLRLIHDAPAPPADLLPAANPATGQPLDMSYCVLRAVSPIHVEYLTNMGVRASMSLSLIHQGRLWGLISCQSADPRHVPLDVRATCELLAQMVSLQLGAAEARDEADYKLHLRDATAHIVEETAPSDDPALALMMEAEVLAGFVRADGLAVVTPDAVRLVGRTPPAGAVRALAEWLGAHGTESVLATDALPDLYPPAAAFVDQAAGLLSVQVSTFRPIYLLWFRREVVLTVPWAADPATEQAEPLAPGLRLRPRTSFDLWKQTVRGHALPWQPFEVLAARDLRHALLAVVLQRLNDELARSNVELDSFAYVASHDLKEPLRGLQNYASLLVEDYGDTLDEEGRRRLAALARLTHRMEDLLEAVLHFSRLGPRALALVDVDPRAVLDEALDSLSLRIAETETTVRVTMLPARLRGDPTLLCEVLVNLISNALKYTDKGREDRWVEIGGIEPGEAGRGPGFYVRDNGIGIPVRHHESIFGIFRRLHPRDAYGGGTGAGLTIVRKIVERHGGRLWLQSAPGEGSTFFVTLASEEDEE